MQLADIIPVLESSRRVPKAELAAAVVHADALAPLVIRCMEQAAAGSILLPRQESLVFYGLHALAAARHTATFAPFLALLRADPEMLDHILGDSITATVPRLAVSLFDGNLASLFDAIADPMIDGFLRWSLLKALAWLAWQGIVPREATLAFLRRLDAEAATPPDDPVWLGWEEAMTLLGQTEFQDRIIARAQGAEPDLRKSDIEDIRTRLAAAAARPEDGARFAESQVAPIDDPVATLSWVRSDPTPLRDALDLDWLAFFLASPEAPSRAMTMEELDGFMAALAVLLVPVPLDAYAPIVWGEPEPPIEGADKRSFIDDILARYPASTGRELAAAQPFLARLSGPRHDDPDDIPFGIDWAIGFLRGTEFDRPAWERLVAHPVHGIAAEALTRMAEGRPDPAAAQTPHVRLAKTSRLLGDVARSAYRFFRNLPIAAPAATLRAAKIGRNDPCPCGSGKKYKKCCGAAA